MKINLANTYSLYANQLSDIPYSSWTILDKMQVVSYVDTKNIIRQHEMVDKLTTYSISQREIIDQLSTYLIGQHEIVDKLSTYMINAVNLELIFIFLMRERRHILSIR